MYYVQDCYINVFGIKLMNNWGGIYNSLIRIYVKLIQMIGGYVQFSYGFNYYGLIGNQCDLNVVICKLKEVDWFED